MGAHDRTAVLSLDLDWAPEEAIEHAFALIDEYQLPATFFITHRSSAMAARLARDPSASSPLSEAAWHPNFLAGRPELEVMDEIAGWVPGATGCRSHVLYWHSRLAPPLQERGVRYTSNFLFFREPGLRPHRAWTGLVELPIWWEDDVHLLAVGERLGPVANELDRPGLKVLDFHPIHLYLNTDRFSRYEAARSSLRVPDQLATFRHDGDGDERLFRALIEGLLESGHTFRTAHEVACGDVGAGAG